MTYGNHGRSFLNFISVGRKELEDLKDASYAAFLV
jgi:hypothetical protein